MAVTVTKCHVRGSKISTQKLQARAMTDHEGRHSCNRPRILRKALECDYEWILLQNMMLCQKLTDVKSGI